MIHEFNERLAWGEKAGDEPFWLDVYRKAFPGMVGCVRNDAGNIAQQRGIDRVILLGNGVTLAIDEKKRAREYNDILLEYLSNDRTNAPGWIEKDLAIDYLAYAFIASKRCYLFPWLMLRRAWRQYGADWRQLYAPVVAENRTYRTLSVPVPIKTLQKAVALSQIIDLNHANPAPLERAPQSVARRAH